MAEPMIIAANKLMNAAQLIAEIEAMKAENEKRKHEGKAPAYGEDAFREAAARWMY